MIGRRERVIVHVRTYFGEPASTIRFTKEKPHMELLVIHRPRGMAETLVVTCGMSELAMTVPDRVEDKSLQYAELCMRLPPSWPTDPSKLDDLTAWPFDTLVDVARLPHQNQTWLWRGHTVYEGNPWPGSNLSSVLLTSLYSFDETSWVVDGEPPIRLFQLVPITAGELALKKERGTGALVDELFDYDPHVFRALEPQRRCAVTGTSRDIPLSSSLPDGGGDVESVANRLALDAAAIIDRFGVWRRALDIFEEAEEQHELMQDNDTAEELREATITARQAHADVVALLRRLTSSPWDIMLAALERVLDAGGAPVVYLEPFRAWRGS